MGLGLFLPKSLFNISWFSSNSTSEMFCDTSVLECLPSQLPQAYL